MLEATDLWAQYGAVPAIRGIDLRVEAGECIVVLGRNGAGKSTTLSVLSGLKRPTRGTVSFEARDITRLRADERVACGLAMVPEGRGIFPSLSVRENLVTGAFQRRLGIRQAGPDIEEVTEHFPRLRERLDQRAGSLSGGEAQMLAVARGLMGRPKILMLDEPSLGLAPRVVEELYDLFRNLRAGGLTLVIVEQYVNLALRFGDRAYVLHKGEIALSGSTADLRGSEDLLDVYMAQGDVGSPIASPARAGRRS